MENIIVWSIVGLTVIILGRSAYKRYFSRTKTPVCSCGEKTCYDVNDCITPENHRNISQ